MPLPVCWAVKVDDWQPDDEEWQYLLRLLPSCVQAEVLRFKLAVDQRRAIVSRLLQRKCCAEVTSLPFSEVEIKRTKGGKPYCASPCDRTQVPNFNFNVSHEGDYVVLTAEPLCMCGIDVAAPQKARNGRPQSAADLLKAFQQQFTSNEWQSITQAGSADAQLQAFQKHWSLKEAFVKARGDGLGFALNQVEFELTEAGPNQVQAAFGKVDGQPLLRWRFSVQQLGEKHVVAVARGPPEDVVDAWGVFKSTFAKPSITSAEMQAALDAKRPAFELLGISDIIPVKTREGYAAAAGELL